MMTTTLQQVPEHIAIIPDGNRRWAKQAGLDLIHGYSRGAQSIKNTVQVCREIGVKRVTIFAFSTENWTRPKWEVNTLMTLMQRYLIKEMDELVEHGIRFHTIGNVESLPDFLLKTIQEVKKKTESGENLDLILAINYGGRDEMVRAVKKMVSKGIKEDEVCERVISQNLDTSHFSDPDLLIRTSGEMRISNFLLWQLSYSELYISQKLWPDFSADDLLDAVECFRKRKRRIGV